MFCELYNSFIWLCKEIVFSFSNLGLFRFTLLWILRTKWDKFFLHTSINIKLAPYNHQEIFCWKILFTMDIKTNKFFFIRKANQIVLSLFSVFFFGLIQWFTLSDAPIWQTPLLSLLALALVASRFHLTVLVYLLTFTYCENLDICTNTLSAPGSGKKLLSFNVNFSTLRFHWA